jgi:hypothetical protein
LTDRFGCGYLVASHDDIVQDVLLVCNVLIFFEEWFLEEFIIPRSVRYRQKGVVHKRKLFFKYSFIRFHLYLFFYEVLNQLDVSNKKVRCCSFP